MNLEQRDIQTCDANSANTTCRSMHESIWICIKHKQLQHHSFSITASASQIHLHSLVIRAYPQSQSSTLIFLDAHFSMKSLVNRWVESRRWSWFRIGTWSSSNSTIRRIDLHYGFILSYICPCDAIMCYTHLQVHRQMCLERNNSTQLQRTASHFHSQLSISIDYSQRLNAALKLVQQWK